MKTINSTAICPYEIGDIFQTISSVNPSERWPGTSWKEIQDRMIRGAGTLQIEAMGGSWTHTQTIDEMATHSHAFTPRNSPIVDMGIHDNQFGLHFTEGGTSSYRANPGGILNTGGGQPMNISNPYYVAHIYVRTA